MDSADEYLQEIAEGIIQKVALRAGDVLVYKHKEGPPSQGVMESFARRLMALVQGDIVIVRLGEDESLETLSDKKFAQVAQAKGFYKAEPDH